MTYLPILSWNLVRLLLTLMALHVWHTKQKASFVQAFAKARPIKKASYIKMTTKLC